ncbi:hypothetical protein F5141DRAFT_1062854 [Pisolithus sp. B1]|nr:hypothetical protein F5141DRAFT_1062854 [Pisolithus sp. B1]
MKADVEAGKDGEDKEEITLPSFFLNFMAQEEMYLEARDAFSGSSALTGPTCAHQEHVVSFVVEYLELGNDRQKWVLQCSMPIFEVERDVSGDITGICMGCSWLAARGKYRYPYLHVHLQCTSPECVFIVVMRMWGMFQWGPVGKSTAVLSAHIQKHLVRED